MVCRGLRANACCSQLTEEALSLQAGGHAAGCTLRADSAATAQPAATSACGKRLKPPAPACSSAHLQRLQRQATGLAPVHNRLDAGQVDLQGDGTENGSSVRQASLSGPIRIAVAVSQSATAVQGINKGTLRAPPWSAPWPAPAACQLPQAQWRTLRHGCGLMAGPVQMWHAER